MTINRAEERVPLPNGEANIHSREVLVDRETARRARWVAFSVKRRICNFGRAFVS